MQTILRKIIFFIFIGFSLIEFKCDATEQKSMRKPRTGYVTLFSGDIIDHSFFDTIIRYLPNNKNYKKNKTHIIRISFAAQSKYDERIIIPIDNIVDDKEYFEHPYFASVDPFETFTVDENNIVVKYKNFYFVVSLIADSILVKKRTTRKKYFYDIDRMQPFFREDMQYIRFEDGQGEEIDLNNPEYSGLYE